MAQIKAAKCRIGLIAFPVYEERDCLAHVRIRRSFVAFASNQISNSAREVSSPAASASGRKKSLRTRARKSNAYFMEHSLNIGKDGRKLAGNLQIFSDARDVREIRFLVNKKNRALHFTPKRTLS
jgi:hypothetical protein